MSSSLSEVLIFTDSLTGDHLLSADHSSHSYQWELVVLTTNNNIFYQLFDCLCLLSINEMVSFCAGLVIILAVATALYPGALIYFLMFVDFYTPWVLFDSPLYDKYHNYLLSNKEESEELPIPELHADNYTVEDIHRLSKDFTFPIVIRGMVENATALDQWMDSEWWVGNYADERVLCGTLDKVREFCTIKDFFDEIENGNPFYISGSSNIFIRNPELQKMIDNPRIVDFEPGPRRLTQVSAFTK